MIAFLHILELIPLYKSFPTTNPSLISFFLSYTHSFNFIFPRENNLNTCSIVSILLNILEIHVTVENEFSVMRETIKEFVRGKMSYTNLSRVWEQ